jgi:hypothetical protein
MQESWPKRLTSFCGERRRPTSPIRDGNDLLQPIVLWSVEFGRALFSSEIPA